ncbi:MAG: hypothetical protein WA810_09845, partial [Maribacter sp.]
SDFDGTTITYKNGDTETCGMLIWGAGVSGALINGLKEEVIHRSKYIVDGFCRIKGYTDIFAIGDISYFTDAENEEGLPGVAQPAIQQGKYVAKLISKREKQKKDTVDVSNEKPFSYFDKGSLATIGRNKAVADLPGGLKFSGFIAWILWAGVHLFYLNGLRNRLLTFLNWVMNYFNYQNKVRLIINPSLKPDDTLAKEFAEVNESGG